MQRFRAVLPVATATPATPTPTPLAVAIAFLAAIGGKAAPGNASLTVIALGIRPGVGNNRLVGQRRRFLARPAFAAAITPAPAAAAAIAPLAPCFTPVSTTIIAPAIAARFTPVTPRIVAHVLVVRFLDILRLVLVRLHARRRGQRHRARRLFGRRPARIDLHPPADQRLVGHHLDGDAITILQLAQLQALAVQHIDGNGAIRPQPEQAGAPAHGLLLQQPQRRQRRRTVRAHQPGALAHVADLRGSLQHARSQPLPAHLQQPERRDAAHLDAGAVVLQRLFQRALHLAVVAVRFHVDKVDDDQPRHVAQAQLPRHFLGRLDIRLQRRFLDIILARRTPRVHIDSHQRLGRVDDDISARFQVHHRVHQRRQLRFHPGPVKQRHRIGIELHAPRMAWHQQLHEILGLAIAFLAIHQHLVDIAAVDVADRPLHQIAVLIDQRRRRRVQRIVADTVPQAGQIIEIAADLRLGPLKARRAHDRPHRRRQIQLRHDRFQPLAIGRVGDLAADAAALRRVGHQHRIAARQRDIGGQRRALVAALLLHHLHQHHLPAADNLLNLIAAAQRHAAAAQRLGARFLAVAMLLGAHHRLAILARFARFAPAIVAAAVVVMVIVMVVMMMVVMIVVVVAAFLHQPLLLAQQRLAVFARDLVIIRVDFRKGEEPVPVPAIIDERRLQRRLHPRHLGEIDVALDLLAGGGLEIKLLDPATFYNGDPGFLRVAAVDQHSGGHVGISCRAGREMDARQAGGARGIARPTPAANGMAPP